MNKAVIQIIGGNTEGAIARFKKLGLGDEQLEKIRKLIQQINPTPNTISPDELKVKITDQINTPQEVLDISEKLSNLEIAEYQVPVIPDDKLVEIFASYDVGKEMSGVAGVCSDWKTNIVPLICIQQLNYKQTLSIRELAIYQKRLGIDFSDFDSIFCHCRNLIGVDFSEAFKEINSKEQQDEILAILSSAKKFCPKLISLNLKNCYAVEINVLNYIKCNFQGLTYLNLSACTRSFGSIQGIVIGLNKLVFLDVSSTMIGNDDIIAIANNCPNLKELNVYDSCGYFATGPVNDESIVYLSQKCKSLNRLILDNCKITDLSLNALAENCKSLTFLFYYGCFLVTEDGFDNLKLNLPDLIISSNFEDVIGKRVHVMSSDTESSDDLDHNFAGNFDYYDSSDDDAGNGYYSGDEFGYDYDGCSEY